MIAVTMAKIIEFRVRDRGFWLQLAVASVSYGEADGRAYLVRAEGRTMGGA